MSKKRVLVIYLSFMHCGGAERLLLNFLNIFPEEKYQIDLLLLDDKQDESKMLDEIKNHINILPFLWQFSTWSPELMQYLRENGNDHMAAVREFVRTRNNDPEFLKLPEGVRYTMNWEELKTICPLYEGYDIAIAFDDSLPLKIVAEKVDASKKFAFIHNDYKLRIEIDKSESYINSLKPYFEKMDVILTGTEQNVKSFLQVFPSNSSEVKVITDTFDNDIVHNKASEYFPQEYTADVINILTIARVVWRKGPELILETARKLKDANVSFRWFILGSIPSDSYYQKCINLREVLGVETEVTFLGVRANPYPYYKHCHLYIQPSYTEGRCLAIEEARILGCPIIATNYASVTDQITDDINGRICEMSSESLADTIVELLDNEKKRIRLAEANANYDGKDIRQYLEYFM